MNNRRKLLVALGAGALAGPLATFAQQSVGVPRIGLLWIETDSPSLYLTAFREGLRALGYVEGKNIRIDDGSLVDRYERLPEAASRLVNQNVDVIVCYGSTATRTVTKLTSAIPIVIISGGDLVKAGVAASLSRPGGNVTGMIPFSTELSAKRLELLKEMVPSIRRVAVVLYPASPGEAEALRSYEAAAKAMSLEVRPVEVRSPDDIGPAIASIAGMKVQAIAFIGSTLFTANKNQVAAAVDKIRLPAIYANIDFALAGGLMAYATNYTDIFRRTAIYVDKILKGAKPGDIPIEQPTRIELAINVKTAKALGIKIPNSIFVRADKVIE